MGVIRAANLDQLADYTEGRDGIGELVRRLIWNWKPSRILGIQFLSGETNNYPGWDGWVRLDMGNGAQHHSLWELSVRRDAPEKIREDFKGSATKKLPPGWKRESTTYVAVTARSLANKDSLETELRELASNIWADVRIIDGKDLEQWVELCPAVERWAAEEFLASGIPSAISLAKYWSRWSGVTKPAISPALMSAGRDVTALTKAVKFEESTFLSLQADSPDEAICILYAVINQLPELQREKLLCNALVLSTADAAVKYAELPKSGEGEPLTILLPQASSQAQQLQAQGHKVVIALGRNNPGFIQISLKRALRSDFEKALTESMGVPPVDAAADARACGGSVSIWRVWQMLRASAQDQLPIWAKSPENSSIVPAVLARAWDEAVEPDQEVLTLLASTPYPAYRDQIHKYTACDDPLHERAGSVHKLIAPTVAYALIRDSVTSTHIQNLSEALQRVFSQVDHDVRDVWETFEISTPISKEPKYSNWLKDGLAETLLAIAFLPQPKTGVLDQYGGGQAFADDLIRKLPGLRSDPRLIASHAGQLPNLAEAAPDPFVEALESLLQGGIDLEPLFRDRGFFGSPYHVGLLWSLEVLAWSPTYLPRVTRLLLNLATRVEAGRSGNNPQNSLREIYLAWLRGTAASVTEKKEILAHLFEEYPNAAWRLLLDLLPKDHDTSSGTQEPKWRDFGRSELKPLTNGEVSRGYRAYAELALEKAEDSFARQVDLAFYFARFPDEYREQLIQMLEKNDSVNESEVETWMRLREFVFKNKAFSYRDWSVDTKNLQKFEEILERTAPARASIRTRWLFDDDWPEIGERPDEFEKRNALVEDLRLVAVDSILQTEGLSRLNSLVRSVKHPRILGGAIAKISSTNDWLLSRISEWADGATQSELEAIRAASGVRYGKEGVGWSAAVLGRAMKEKWPSQVLAYSLLDFPSSVATFNSVESCGAEVVQLYWKNCWLNTRQMDAESRVIATRKLIENERALYLLSLINRHFVDFGSTSVLEVLRAAVHELLKSKSAIGNMGSYDIEEALQWLRRQPEIDRMELASLEYPLIPLLTGGGSDNEGTLVLHELLSENPAFFMELICTVFRGRAEAEANPDPVFDDAISARATAGWRLLQSWKIVPGARAGGVIDEEALTKWIAEAIRLARENDRLDIAWQKIGEVIFHAKSDPLTNEWPPVPVLNVIEKMASEELESGFALESVNSRGVTTRSPLSGGTLERDLEVEWRDRAKKLSKKYIRSRALFMRIAADWSRNAAWHDERAAQTRMQWS